MKILINRNQIADRVKELGEQISLEFKGQEVVFICILKGSVIFFADLMREIKDVDAVFEFIQVSSYGFTASSGEVKLVQDLSISIENKNVVIVEDIVDSGLTLNYLIRILLARLPRCLKICTLLDKPDMRKADIKTDYTGFIAPPVFVIGYGLDCGQKYRNLPDICQFDNT